MKRSMITFLMPALNEEAGIVAAIQTVPVHACTNAGYDVEILIVDGHSTDRTASLAQQAGARVIASERGYGRQYQAGFRAAKGDIIVTGDSDGTYPFEDSLHYIKALTHQQLDFITVNRFARMEPGAMHFSNRVGNFGLTLWANILFFLALRDSQSGMWIIRKAALSQIHPRFTGMPFSQELKIEAFRKLRSKELPGSYKRRYGETKLLKFKDGFGNLFALFKQRFAYH